MGYNMEFDGEFAVKNFDRNDDFIKSRIFTTRGIQVMLDRDLAVLYGVTVKRLNEQVKRNINRFPDSFMFRLSNVEIQQIITTCASLDNCSRSWRFPNIWPPRAEQAFRA